MIESKSAVMSLLKVNDHLKNGRLIIVKRLRYSINSIAQRLNKYFNFVFPLNERQYNYERSVLLQSLLL